MKLMVFDDEPIVTTALQKLIPWQEHGFEWCGSAGDGETAWEMIQRSMPDLVIVDCKMPILDGLDLLKNIYEHGLPVKSIMLSGYDEFDYAREAMKWGASDYHLKPPDLEKLLETCLRLKAERENELRLKRQLEENKSLMIERYLRKLIECGKINPDEFAEQTRFLGLKLEPGPYALALFEAADIDNVMAGYTYDDRQLMQFAIQNIAEETLSGWPHKAMFQDAGQRLVMIINLSSKDDAARLRDDFRQLIDNVKKTLKLSSIIGGSRIYDKFPECCHIAYENAKLAIEYKYYTGWGHAIFIDDLDGDGAKAGIHQSLQHGFNSEHLRMALKVCNQPAMEAWLDDFFQRLREGTHTSDETKTISLETVIMACHSIIQIHPALQLDSLLTNADIDQIFRAETINDLEHVIRAYMNRLFAKTQTIRKADKNLAVEKVKKYIQEHYAENITLESIASEVYLTPAYLSFHFKQVEMITITDYLTNVRLEKARELLRHTNMKVNDIAVQVGYPDNKYFSRLFRKKVGMTPVEYRQASLLTDAGLNGS